MFFKTHKFGCWSIARLTFKLVRNVFYLCATCCALFTNDATCLPSYQADVSLDGLQCPGLTFDLGVARSKLDCSLRCDAVTGCRSFFFNAITLTCEGAWLVITSPGGCSSQLGSVYYITTDITTTSSTTSTTTTSTMVTTTTTLQPAPAPIYGNMCSSNSQCTSAANTACLEGTCQCSAGYRLEPATLTCTTSCTTYGTTYIFFPNIAFYATVLGSQAGISMTQCMTYCSGMASCTGFNFCASCGNMCRCKTGSPLDSPSDWVPSDGVDYYSRNCA